MVRFGVSDRSLWGGLVKNSIWILQIGDHLMCRFRESVKLLQLKARRVHLYTFSREKFINIRLTFNHLKEMTQSQREE